MFPLKSSPSFIATARTHHSSSCRDLFSFSTSPSSVFGTFCHVHLESLLVSTETISLPDCHFLDFSLFQLLCCGLGMVSKTGYSTAAIQWRRELLWVCCVWKSCSHITNLLSFSWFSSGRTPLPSPLSLFRFTRTLISCGFLVPGPIRMWKAISTVCMQVRLNFSVFERAGFARQLGWVQAGCWAAFAAAYLVLGWTQLHWINNCISVSACHAKQAKDCNFVFF